jgi:hypothetical protein
MSIKKTPKFIQIASPNQLKRISSYLGKVEQRRFELLLECWHKRHREFIKEKTYNIETGKWHYTHRRLRSAYRSLKTNLPYLFLP